MNKEVRKAVRTFLIDEDKVLAIKYKSGNGSASNPYLIDFRERFLGLE